MANMHYRRGMYFDAAVADFAAELYADKPDDAFLRQNLRTAVQEELTERQREMVLLYYGENLTMAQVGQRLGVSKSCVSRTIQRSEKRLQKCLKYGAGRLLRDPKM